MSAPPPGYLARDLAVRVIHEVTLRRQPLDDVLSRWTARTPFDTLDARDRAFARLLIATTLRHHGRIAHVIASFLEKPLPEDRGRLFAILLTASAHLLFLDGPPHAVINLAVEQCKRAPPSRRFAKLTNAVLRRISQHGLARLANLDEVTLDVPAWLLTRWQHTYGPELARDIAQASLREAALDLTVKADAAAWAVRTGGMLLPTGSVRISAAGRVEDLPGYADGQWWVQDTAATLPARMLGKVAGRDIADLCAAPGGKTAQLVAAGANVTAVDISPTRLARLRANLARLHLAAQIVEADVLAWEPSRTFDAVLLDAPCSATGTIRRHPDILHLKIETDITRLLGLQQAMLDKAAHLVRPGGRLVYCTCSLEPEEGPDQIARFLERHQDFTLFPLTAAEIGVDPAWITPVGSLRTLPCHLPLENPAIGGMDGFYAALFVRRT